MFFFGSRLPSSRSMREALSSRVPPFRWNKYSYKVVVPEFKVRTLVHAKQSPNHRAAHPALDRVMLDKIGSAGLPTVAPCVQWESHPSEASHRLPVYTSSPEHTPTLHSGLTVWFVPRCPGGCGKLPEQTDPGACWWEAVRDQPTAPTAPEVLQFGSLPGKVRDVLAPLPTVSICWTGCISLWATQEHLLLPSVLKTN